MDQIVAELYKMIRKRIAQRYPNQADLFRLLHGVDKKKGESWRTRLLRYDYDANNFTITEALHLCSFIGESLPELLIAAKMNAHEDPENGNVKMAAEGSPEYGEKKAVNH